MSGVRQLFFTGKGGVGKSTVALLTGKFLAGQGQRVLISSLDPAHNTGDILEMELSREPVKLSENLTVQEISIGAYLDRYFTEIEKHDPFFAQIFGAAAERQMLRYSPGMEEFAMLSAYYEIVHSQFGYDCFIWDMPSTALALRFFQAPGVSLFWLEKLLTMRRQIIHKRKELAAHTEKDGENDKVYDSLIHQFSYYDQLQRELTDEKKASIYIIVNNDSLSRLEGQRLRKNLLETGIENFNLVMNMACSNTKEWRDETTGRLYKGYALPASDSRLQGAALDEYVKLHSAYFDLLLTPNQ
jgi:arsenite/tail-anchored protein-transporting ATPase